MDNLDVSWAKCKNDVWCSLDRVILTDVTTYGVYVIWYVTKDGKIRVVRVGKGDIKSRLQSHRNDTDITKYSKYGALLTTWARVSEKYVDGVEKYLGDMLDPDKRHPDVDPIRVNLPAW